MDNLQSVVAFLGQFVSFIINALIGIFSAVGRLSSSIFNQNLFTWLNSTFDYLALYLGSAGATILMGLFGLAFMIIIFSFVVRFLRGRNNYDSALKKYNKYHPSK